MADASRFAPRRTSARAARSALCLATALAFFALTSACGRSRLREARTDGERVYLTRCTSCHASYEPAERTPEEWQAAVAKMERWKKVSLSPGDRALILGYLTGSGSSEPSPSPAAGPRG